MCKKFIIKKLLNFLRVFENTLRSFLHPLPRQGSSRVPCRLAKDELVEDDVPRAVFEPSRGVSMKRQRQIC